MRPRPALALLLLTALAATHGSAQTGDGEWRYYGGDAASRKYSPLAEIAAANVGRLQVVWQWTSVDDAVVAANPTARPGAYQDTPLMADGVLYTVTSLGQIAALAPGTGVARWVFDPGSWKTGRPGNGGTIVTRRDTCWSAGRKLIDEFAGGRWLKSTRTLWYLSPRGAPSGYMSKAKTSPAQFVGKSKLAIA